MQSVWQHTANFFRAARSRVLNGSEDHILDGDRPAHFLALVYGASNNDWHGIAAYTAAHEGTYDDFPVIIAFAGVGGGGRARAVDLPAGNAWRVVSITALASVGNVVTSDVDTFLESNPTFEVKATECGSIETYILPRAVLTATAQKKRQIGAASVVVIVTVRKL